MEGILTSVFGDASPAKVPLDFYKKVRYNAEHGDVA